MAFMQPAQRQQGIDALAAGFANADQDAGGKRDRSFAGKFDGAQPGRGQFVRRTEMRTATLAQAFGTALEHDPLRDGDAPQRGNIGSVQQPGVDMRKQTGFPVDQLGGLGKIGQRAVMALCGERIAGCRVAQFRLIA
ncbi:hypothetical protein D3C81_1075530 [compost metagenome]